MFEVLVVFAYFYYYYFIARWMRLSFEDILAHEPFHCASLDLVLKIKCFFLPQITDRGLMFVLLI